MGVELRHVMERLQSRVERDPQVDALQKTREQGKEILEQSLGVLENLSAKVSELEMSFTRRLDSVAAEAEKQLTERLINAVGSAYAEKQDQHEMELQRLDAAALARVQQAVQQLTQAAAAQFAAAREEFLKASHAELDYLQACIRVREQAIFAMNEAFDKLQQSLQSTPPELPRS